MTVVRSLALSTLAGLLALAPPSPARAADPGLVVAQAGPEGEVQQLSEAAEVRVVFSQPMVALGRIPEPVVAPFFHIEPRLAGSFRWSGTRTLIFTPADPEKLPHATRFSVTIDAAAASVDGVRLGKPYRFSFTTPTVRLLHTEWYRRARRFDSPVVIALRFNQPVTVATVLPALRLDMEPHPFEAPAVPAGDAARAVDPQSLTDFAAKVAQAQTAASGTAAVPFKAAASWDQKRFAPADDLVVLETDGVPPTDAWLKLTVSTAVTGRQGTASPAEEQTYTVKLERTFFIDGFRCAAACDPDGWNPLKFRARVAADRFRPAVRATDVTDPARPKPVEKAAPPKKDDEQGEGEGGEDDEVSYDSSWSLSLPDAGLGLLPARTYEVLVDRTLRAADGQVLGYTWAGRLENWHQGAFTSFGSGHGVWEASGGPLLPYHARNLQSATEWVSALKVDDLMPAVRRLQENSFQMAPPGSGALRRLQPKADTIQSFGLDLKSVLGGGGTGLLWAGLKNGTPIARSHAAEQKARSTVVQVTSLGISLKDSPSRSLVLVTRLDDGQPVAGATVTFRDLDNKPVWSGTTGADGVAIAEKVALRDTSDWWKFTFLLTAEKDGDVAYVGSNWDDGLEPWNWGLSFDLSEAKPLLRGSLFADRGVYKLGEEVHFKTILRTDTAEGVQMLPAGATASVLVTDTQGAEIDKRTLPLNAWGGADWAFTVPAQGPLGYYEVAVTVAGQERRVAERFLVAAYRRPDFRVDANLAGETTVAGVTLKGVVDARYLFGAPMGGRPVKWAFTRTALADVPRAIEERWPAERWVLRDEEAEPKFRDEEVMGKEAALDAQGKLLLDLPTDATVGVPVAYTVEGEVTDVSRQTIAGRASFRVDPAPWYLGVRRPPFFADVQTGIDTEVAAVDLAGTPAAGVAVHVALTQVQWHAVRQAEGQGFYTWQTERREVPAGEWDVTTTAAAPQPLHVPLKEGGFFVLRATARDAAGHHATAATSFYVLGPGYTAWERYDNNRIDLVPEKKRYRPGETARIMIKSPWEKATALLTTEREGVRTHKVFALSSTQETVSVPVTEAEIPNVYVSVVLVKGRTGGFSKEDTTDPGKPAFRVGYAELKVEDASKRLAVSVKADRAEYRPGARAKVEVAVADWKGKPAPGEVTLWAVDYGVLSLTGYKTPDVLSSVWVEKALQVTTEDTRLNLISRRVLVSKGADEGGGGGVEAGPGSTVRKDFRVLAFWLGSVATDAQGRATTTVTLPESLTTYRVMAVANDKASRFGGGELEIRTSKPVLLKAAFPRFLTTGDVARFGSVVHSQLKDKGTAIVTMRSLDPSALAVGGDGKQTVEVPAKGAVESRFEVKALAPGNARLQMSVKLKGETDAFEDVIPVRVPSSPEVVAAYGQAAPDAKETIELPGGVAPNVGGLHLESASTALVGLGEGARYLVEYPYGCAEQRSSAALGLMLAADLGDAFRLPGIEAGKVKQTAADTLLELESFQCEDGGFAFWKGECRTESPYLTGWVLHVYQRGKALGYATSPAVLEKGYKYLEEDLGQPQPTNAGWWPSYTAWQAFAVKVLAEGGKNVDSHVTRLAKLLDRMPVFAQADLLDAVVAAGDKGKHAPELERRVRNAILPEAGTAHVGELADPYLLYFWNSDVRSTAIALRSLVRRKAEGDLVPSMARWLLKARRNGRWGNTQENAHAMEALVDYYRAYEKETPDFSALVSLGTETLVKQEFRGRSAESQVKDVPMSELAGKIAGQPKVDLAFHREGTGTLFYTVRLRYAPEGLARDPLDAGFRVERRFEPAAGGAATASFKAGDLVKVTLTFHLTKERRFVAVVDPLPAGLEPVESWFATTARDLARAQQDEEAKQTSWASWWEEGGFDHVERHDDRVQLFATRLAKGDHTFSYVARATTAGTFRTGPTRAEEMYEPEVFGRTAGETVTVQP